MASRMSDAVYETTSVKIEANGYCLRCRHRKLNLKDFYLYINRKMKRRKKCSFQKADEESGLTLEGTEQKQHFTHAPAHFTEASLVKTLEELGIGRPSTYAPTITTIIARRYVAKENKNLYITELGEVVNNIMWRLLLLLSMWILRQIWSTFWIKLQKVR